MPTNTMSADEIKRISAIPQWRHQIQLPHQIVTPGMIDTKKELSGLQIAEDLSGLRVLDIGCSDGFYSFICERRNAKEVIAIDDCSSLFGGGQSGFAAAREILNSSVKFFEKSVYDISEPEMGRFDIVLFLNVIYHLRHPLLALEKIRSVMNDGALLYVKSFYVHDIGLKFLGREIGFNIGSRPWARFYPNNELGGDPTNWWGPILIV